MPEGASAYLPYTLPGEAVHATGLSRRGQGWTGQADVISPSPDRQPPPCPHFGACGGCTLQHWRDAPYAAWKAARVQAALTRAGFADPPMAPLARTPDHDRRRVDLALLREARGVLVGLHRHRGRDVVDMHTCLVLDPRLVQLTGALRSTLPRVTALRRTGSAVANLLDSGVDLLLRTDAALSSSDYGELTELARQVRACRVSWAWNGGRPETVCQLTPATTVLAGKTVAVPPGAFLQASHAGEHAVRAAVLAGLPDGMPARAHVVELFAGCGTLTFGLANRARVTAYEGDAATHAALQRAAGGTKVTAIHRDLARQPLQERDMANVAAVVLDPPFAGAPEQMAAIAAAGASRVIYVSCNPAALARDARLLQAAGYSIHRATPVDQFLWSAAVESVVVFRRDRAARRA